MSILYVVATPIGNLEDVTLRALRILKEVDLILAEDTRVTKKLLQHYSISTPTMSYHANSKITKIEKILERLQCGETMALVSDAGTPTISDPGIQLLVEVKRQAPDVSIVTVPGATALTAALSIAAMPTAQFTFLGFLPHKKGRETLFAEIAEAERAMVMYESPHRILKTLASLAEHAPTKTITIARELTKIHESVISGTAAELLTHFELHPDTVRGEFVVIVTPA